MKSYTESIDKTFCYLDKNNKMLYAFWEDVHTAKEERNMKNNQTGYPSIDRPWLKYYREDSADRELPKRTLYEFLWDGNKDHLDDVALVYGDRKFTYGELFRSVEAVARSFSALGVKKGDVVTLLLLNTPESVFCFYALNKLGAISNYVNVLSTKEDIAHELDECGGKYLLALDVFLDRVPEINGLKVITVSLVESLGVVAKIAYRAKVKTIKNQRLHGRDSLLQVQTIHLRYTSRNIFP